MDSPRQRLYREDNGYLLGVIQGVATWSGLPVLALRIIAVILLFKAGFVLMGIAYLGSALLMPPRPE